MKMQNKQEKQKAAKEAHLAERNAKKVQRRQKPNIERLEATKAVKPRMLIYCEGKNTEPSYFNSLEQTNVEVVCFGNGKNTLSLVKEAFRLKEEAEANENPYDEVWCVFDRDPATATGGGHKPQNFNQAIQEARAKGIGVAYSIQAFEYWLILHFEAHQGGKMPRTDYARKLNNYLNKFKVAFDPNSKIITKAIIELLEGKDPKTGEMRRKLAYRRAKRLLERSDYNHKSPANEESSTSVHLLMKSIFPDDHKD